MYDALDWPASAERLVQAAEYLLNTGSAKVYLYTLRSVARSLNIGHSLIATLPSRELCNDV